MTTPVPDLADWAQLVVGLRDAESIRFAMRLVEMQRQTLDSQAAHVGELHKQLEERARKMEGGKGAAA
jgi:hypothetical protein